MSYENLGYLSWPENQDRINCNELITNAGLEVSVQSDEVNNTFLIINLNALSPFGRAAARYCIPFTPYEGFHLDKASLNIFETTNGKVRIEISIAEEKFFSEAIISTNLIYGIELQLKDCCGLEKRVSGDL